MAPGVEPLKAAAVLVPVFRGRDGDVRLVLVRRSDRGVHGGQLAFPGGRCEAGDASPLATALREAWEEVGLASGRAVILTALPAVETFTTGFVISPFLARIDPPALWHPQEEEIIEVIEMRITELARPELRGIEVMTLSGGASTAPQPFIRVGPHRLWGVSLRILDPLLPRLMAGEWPL